MKRITISAILVTAVAAPLMARTIPTYDYDDLFAKSDFVVIAEPLQKTHDTAERSTLRDVNPPVPVIGVETEFQSQLVLKGRKRDRFTLHHYREKPQPPPKPGIEGIIMDGLMLVTFDPKNEKPVYLLFLVHEPDGRFAPTGGQTDVDTISVWQLSPVAR
jgi:hypothetical protein